MVRRVCLDGPGHRYLTRNGRDGGFLNEHLEMNVRYVDSDIGNDSNDGRSRSTAFETLEAALAVAEAGFEYRLYGQFTPASPLTITDNGIRLIGSGGITRNEVPAVGTVINADTTSMTLFTVDGTAGLIHAGPEFSNINFVDTAAKTTTLIHLHNVDRWLINRCGFRDSLKAIYLTREDSPGDNAWGVIDGNCVFRDNGYGIHAVRSYGFEMVGGQMDTGDTFAIDLDQDTQHVKILGTKFDNCAVRIQGAHNSIVGSSFEKCSSPMVTISSTGAGQLGRRNQVIGCSFVGDGTDTGWSVGTGCNDNQMVANTFTNLSTRTVNNGTGTYIAGMT